MRVTIAAVGRLKAGPQRTLFDDYLRRADAFGRRLGLTVDLREVPEARARDAGQRRRDETGRLLAHVPQNAKLIALDEGGKNLSSTDLAGEIAAWRDGGIDEIVFAIGGPDGHGPQMAARADLVMAFGAATWPHQLVRVMLAEQIYRAETILAGHPYHNA